MRQNEDLHGDLMWSNFKHNNCRLQDEINSLYGCLILFVFVSNNRQVVDTCYFTVI
jgi:hypothetical protein